MTQTTEKKSLDEALAERRSEEEEVVLDIRVNDKYELECETNDGWETACELRDLPDHSFNDNTTVIESARQAYQELQTKVDSVLNDDGYWELEYRYSDDRESDTLVVPLATSITDDVEVYEIHDEDLNPKDEYVELLESEDLKRSDTLYTKHLTQKSAYNTVTKKKNADGAVILAASIISYFVSLIVTLILITLFNIGQDVAVSVCLVLILAISITIISLYKTNFIEALGDYTDYEKVL